MCFFFLTMLTYTNYYSFPPPHKSFASEQSALHRFTSFNDSCNLGLCVTRHLKWLQQEIHKPRDALLVLPVCELIHPTLP